MRIDRVLILVAELVCIFDQAIPDQIDVFGSLVGVNLVTIRIYDRLLLVQNMQRRCTLLCNVVDGVVDGAMNPVRASAGKRLSRKRFNDQGRPHLQVYHMAKVIALRNPPANSISSFEDGDLTSVL